MRQFLLSLFFLCYFLVPANSSGDSTYTPFKIGVNAQALSINTKTHNGTVFNPKIELFIGKKDALFLGADFFDFTPGGDHTLTNDFQIGYQHYPWGNTGPVNVFFFGQIYYEGYSTVTHFTDVAYPNISVPGEVVSHTHTFAPAGGIGLHINLKKGFYIQLNAFCERMYATVDGNLNKDWAFGASGGLGYRITAVK
jgi:hypothetical protein